VLLELRDPSAALVHLRRARTLKPRPDVDFNIVRAEIEAGRVSQARADAENAAQVLGSDFQWNAAIGQLFLKNAQPKEAAVYLRNRLLQRAGQQDAALEMAKKATTLAPNWDEPYYLAGVSYYFKRLYDEAAQSLGRAVELNPNSARALFLEAIALANRGKIQEAEEG